MIQIIILYVAAFLSYANSLNCPSNYYRTGSYCYHISRTKRFLYETLEYCYQMKGHLMSLKEASEFDGNFRFSHNLIAANRFYSGPSPNVVFDNDLGFANVADYVPWTNVDPSSQPEAIVIGIVYTRNIFDTEVQIDFKTHCILNRQEDKKRDRFHTLTPGFRLIQKKYHSQDYGKKFALLLIAQNRVACIAECYLNDRCKAAYYSKATKKCSLRIHMDTFLHVDDMAVANDFERYLITK